MSSDSSTSLHPAWLPVGTQVGPFRVVDWAGRGVHGAVYRAVLATGSYPELGQPYKDGQGTWHMDSLVLPQALYSARVAPPLRELILRMLSLRPEQRGSPAQLAQDMERAADSLGGAPSPPSLSVPELPEVRSAEARACAPARPARARVPLRRRLLALTVAVGALLTGGAWMMLANSIRAVEDPRLASVAEKLSSKVDAPDAGPAGLGEAAASTAAPAPAQPSAFVALAADSLSEPSEGQAQPDKKGRCPHPRPSRQVRAERAARDLARRPPKRSGATLKAPSSPSCNAKRAHEAAVHLVDQMLPHVPYRQWTLSFPHRVWWVLLKEARLLSDVLIVFLPSTPLEEGIHSEAAAVAS